MAEVLRHLFAAESLGHFAAAVGKLGVVPATEGVESAGFFRLELGLVVPGPVVSVVEATASRRLAKPFAETPALRRSRCAVDRRRSRRTAAGPEAVSLAGPVAESLPEAGANRFGGAIVGLLGWP